MSAKKILIIGSHGYLGSRITDFLSEKGYLCVGADIGFFRNGVIHEPTYVPSINKEARTIEESDIEGFDVVIMLAGISNDPFGNLSTEVIYDPTRAYAFRIAKICKKLGIRFIFPSSCSVYGIADGMLDENGVTNPQTPYSLNKLQIEQDLATISNNGFSPIALRLATVFGLSPRIRFDVVINMLCGMAVSQKKVVLNSDGQAWRPHVHIEDVCEAFRCCIEWENPGEGLKVLNVGRNDNNVRIIDVARMIVECIPGSELQFLSAKKLTSEDELVVDKKIHDGVDSRTYQVKFNKVHEQLPNFTAKWGIQRGVAKLVEDLQSLQLDENKFKQRDFYRLQQINHLYITKQINSDLFWNRN
jgi:nucleoside-diphosphate-sugar epimerase